MLWSLLACIRHSGDKSNDRDVYILVLGWQGPIFIRIGRFHGVVFQGAQSIDGIYPFSVTTK